MCIRHISHWQPCRHQRCTAIDICSYAEAHPGLSPSDCPKGEIVFREEAERGECKICGERREHSKERRDGRGESLERHEHSKERHEVRDESLESVSTVDSDSTERGDHGREKDRGDRHDKSKGDGGQEKKDKKDSEDKGKWDGVLALGLMGLAHAAS